MIPGMTAWLTWAAIPLLFLAVWLVVLWVISWLGGWRRLARHYRSPEPWKHTGLGWQSLYLDRGICFRGSVKAQADEHGLHLSVWPIFRAFHPPLTIPWEDLSGRRLGPTSPWGRMLVTRTVLLSARLTPEVPLILSERLAEKLSEKTGASWLCA